MRQVDQLFRLGLPKETLGAVGIFAGDAVEFSLRDGKEVVVAKHGCAFCGADGLVVCAGRPGCRGCANGLATLLGGMAQGGPAPTGRGCPPIFSM